MTTETVQSQAEVIQPSALSVAQDNMITALERMIMFAVDSAEKAGEMLTEQVPDIVMQLLTWHALKYGINAFIGLVFVILTVWLCVNILRECSRLPPDGRSGQSTKWKYSSYYDKWITKDSWDIIISIKIIAAIIAGLVGAIMLYKNLMLTLYIVVAPKLYLIEYGVDLVRKMSGN